MAPMTAAVKPSTKEIGYLLNRAARRWNTLFMERLRVAGITDIRPSFGAVLVPLFERDGLRLGQIAQEAGLSKQTVTNIADRIEALGYLARRPDPEDGRAVRVYLTPKARALEDTVAEALAEMGEVTANLARGLDLDAAALWLADLGDQEGS
jgi:DNA-binding MarR family transcriptional regulator